MDDAGRLYRTANPAAEPWVPNLDRYSGFLRRPSGRLAPDEQRLVRDIAAGHPGSRAVRLFPRQVDALLLGGLGALIGPGYGKLSRIQARYRLSGDQVLVERIIGDGRAVDGRIDLSPASAGRCRHGLI